MSDHRRLGTEFDVGTITEQDVVVVTRAARRYITDEDQLADVLDMLLGEAGRFSARNPGGYMKARYGLCPVCRRRTEMLVGKQQMRNHPVARTAGAARCDGSLMPPVGSVAP